MAEFLDSLKAENAAMEAAITHLEHEKTRGFETQALAATVSSAISGIRIHSWNPPVVTQAGVDYGSSWRPPQTGERKKDGNLFVGS